MSREPFEAFLCEADLAEGEIRGIQRGDRWIAVLRHRDEYFGLDGACAHSGYPIFKGNLNAQGVVTCPLHYAQFDCRTGAVVSDPAICGAQPTVRVRVRDGGVYWINEKGEAEEIPLTP